MSKTYIAIDNGVTGQIAFFNITPFATSIRLIKTPVKKELSYTKTKQYISRVDIVKLEEEILSFLENSENESILAILERPIVNPGRFKATVSGLRALEATLVTLERLNIGIRYMDSKEWQKELLPKGLKGEELKAASLDIGNRLFPQFTEFKHKDRDGLLIGEYARRKQLL